MKTIRKHSTLLVLALALTALPGCVVAVGVGVGTLGLAYIQGEHQVDVSAGPAKTIQAVSQTVVDHGFILISSRSDELGGEVIARTKTDAKVRVTAQRLASGHSRLWVRIGVLGNEALSDELLTAIRERLGSPAE
jgi:hypothetical protein